MSAYSHFIGNSEASTCFDISACCSSSFRRADSTLGVMSGRCPETIAEIGGKLVKVLVHQSSRRDAKEGGSALDRAGPPDLLLQE